MTDAQRLYEDALETSIGAMNRRASLEYPSRVVGDHSVHVYEQDGVWHVWLNTEIADFDGVCLGVGPTRDEAVSRAVRSLEACVAALQEPPA